MKERENLKRLILCQAELSEDENLIRKPWSWHRPVKLGGRGGGWSGVTQPASLLLSACIIGVLIIPFIISIHGANICSFICHTVCRGRQILLLNVEPVSIGVPAAKAKVNPAHKSCALNSNNVLWYHIMWKGFTLLYFEPGQWWLVSHGAPTSRGSGCGLGAWKANISFFSNLNGWTILRVGAENHSHRQSNLWAFDLAIWNNQTNDAVDFDLITLIFGCIMYLQLSKTW